MRRSYRFPFWAYLLQEVDGISLFEGVGRDESEIVHGDEYVSFPSDEIVFSFAVG